MPLITVLDSGVGNAVNYGDYPINVDSTVSLSTLAVRLVGAAGAFRGRGFFRENLEVDIIAHGRVPRVGPGCCGADLCREGLTISTVGMLRPINGKFKRLNMKICGLASIEPGHEGGVGDGNVLCQMLADVTGAAVRASTATQHGSYRRMDTGKWVNVNPGHWEGPVLTYMPSAGVVNVENNPLVWRNEEGNATF